MQVRLEDRAGEGAWVVLNPRLTYAHPETDICSAALVVYSLRTLFIIVTHEHINFKEHGVDVD